MRHCYELLEKISKTAYLAGCRSGGVGPVSGSAAEPAADEQLCGSRHHTAEGGVGAAVRAYQPVRYGGFIYPGGGGGCGLYRLVCDRRGEGQGSPGTAGIQRPLGSGGRYFDSLRPVLPHVGRELLDGQLSGSFRHYGSASGCGRSEKRDHIFRGTAVRNGGYGATGRKRRVRGAERADPFREPVCLRRRDGTVSLSQIFGYRGQGSALLPSYERHGLYRGVLRLRGGVQCECGQPRLPAALHHRPRAGPPAGCHVGAGVQLFGRVGLCHQRDAGLHIFRLAAGVHPSWQRLVRNGPGGLLGHSGHSSGSGGGGSPG